MFGTCLEYRLDMLWISLGHVWNLLEAVIGTCLRSVLDHLGDIFGTCFESVKLRSSLGQVFANFDKHMYVPAVWIQKYII